jgi:hypothetical protein
MKKLDVSKILVLTAMTVTLMACGGTQTDQSEGLNQQDTSSLKASPRTEGGGSVAAPEGGGSNAKPSVKASPRTEGGGSLVESDEGGGSVAKSTQVEFEEGGGSKAEPSDRVLPEGGGSLVELDEGGGSYAKQELPEGGGSYTLEGNVLVLRGTMPKGATEGLLLINGKEFYKLEITKDGSFVMKIELSDEDLTQMGFQLAFKDEVKNFIIIEEQIQEVIVKK